MIKKNRDELRQIERKHGFKFSKNLGQNFLTDDRVVKQIVEGAKVSQGDFVIEIGPGSGALTKALADRVGKVMAIEIDKTVIPVLQEALRDKNNVEIINEDILNMDLKKLIKNEKIKNRDFESVKIIGNLSYYITTPIIMGILKDKIPTESITCMVQKEVAERINAKVGTKAYGGLSVAVNYFCDVSKICDVPKEMFIPMPKVDSAVINLKIRRKKPVEIKDEEGFFDVIKASFRQRRKTLQNALSGYKGIDKEEMGNLLVKAGIDSSRRAETLGIEEFANLANIIAANIEGNKID